MERGAGELPHISLPAEAWAPCPWGSTPEPEPEPGASLWLSS